MRDARRFFAQRPNDGTDMSATDPIPAPDSDAHVGCPSVPGSASLAMIREYLAVGGLFNPELMEHARVRDMVMLCRDEITRLRSGIDCAVNALTDSILSSGNDGATNIHFVRKLKALLSEPNTYSGTDVP